MREFFVRHLPERPDATASPASPAAVPARTLSLDLDDLDDDASELRGAIERYEADRSSLLRTAPAPGSPKRDERIRDFTSGWLDRLGRLDFDRLGRDGQVDFLLFRNHLNHELRQIEIREQERAEWEPMVPFARPILDLEAARRELKPMDWAQGRRGPERPGQEDRRVAARRWSARAAGQDRAKAAGADRAERVRAANRALASVEGLRNTLRTWFAFYDGYDPVFSWWMQEPYKAADQALQAHAAFLRQRYRRLGGRRGGRHRFRRPQAGRRRGAAVPVEAAAPAGRPAPAMARGNPPSEMPRSSAPRSAARP